MTHVTSVPAPISFVVLGFIHFPELEKIGRFHTVLLESLVMTGFLIAAVAGFKSSGWIVVGALAGHGVLDAFHGRVLENSGVPVWWPAFCLAYDLGAAGGLAWLIKRQPRAMLP